MIADSPRYFASLNAYHASASPFDVTDVLAIPHDRVHRVGQGRLQWASDEVLEVDASTWRHSFWSVTTQGRVEADVLEPHVAWLLSLLRRRASAVARLRHAGWSLRVFCFASGGSEPPQVASSIRAELAALDVRYEVDHYPDVDDAQEDAAWAAERARYRAEVAAELRGLAVRSEPLHALCDRIAAKGVPLPEEAAQRVAPSALLSLVAERGVDVAVEALRPLLEPEAPVGIEAVFDLSAEACIFVVLAAGGGDRSWLDACRRWLRLRGRSAPRARVLNAIPFDDDDGLVRGRAALLAALSIRRMGAGFDLFDAVVDRGGVE